MTPGPTPAPPEVLAAIAQPVIHHRGPDYRDALRASASRRLREVFRTEQRGAALRRLGHRRDGVGGREPLLAGRAACWWSRRATSASAGPRSPRPTAPSVDHLALRVGRDPVARTTIAPRLREREARAPSSSRTPRPRPASSPTCSAFAAAAARRPARSSSSTRSRASARSRSRPTPGGIDVVASGSQKALMTPPGLAMVTVSPAAWERAAAAASPRFYFDWERTREGQADARRAVHARRSRSSPG